MPTFSAVHVAEVRRQHQRLAGFGPKAAAGKPADAPKAGLGWAIALSRESRTGEAGAAGPGPFHIQCEVQSLTRHSPSIPSKNGTSIPDVYEPKYQILHCHGFAVLEPQVITSALFAWPKSAITCCSDIPVFNFKLKEP